MMPRGIPAIKTQAEEAGKKLTPKQKAFVDTLITTGCTKEQAAIEAGYAEGSATVSAWRCGQNPAVQEYMDLCIRAGIGMGSVVALNRLLSLTSTARSEYVQLQAAQDLMDRAGYKAVEKSMIALKGDVNIKIDLS